MIYSMYSSYKNKDKIQPTHFDLFVVEEFYEKGKEKEYLWSEFWSEAWNNAPLNKKRPIQWFFNKESFEKFDSIYVGFKNISKEKIYYVTWGEPNSRMRDDLVIYRKGEIDSIPFGGFGCGTGIYIAPLKNGKTAGSKILNPFMFNPYTGYKLPLKNKIFPELFKEIYGDSVSIKFKQATYSLPWNKLPSQMIESNEIVISTERIIENWKKGNLKIGKDFEKEYKSSYLIKGKDDYIISPLFESSSLNKKRNANKGYN
ncbi:hypothetical protein OAT18_00475 [Tenacibaculum sp.]|nr:hypothetical protein [Tenacibaculum sp.]